MLVGAIITFAYSSQLGQKGVGGGIEVLQ